MTKRIPSSLIYQVFTVIFINLILWNIFIPVFEFPSEQLYFDRIQFIAQNKKLPDLRTLSVGAIAWPDTYPALMAPIFALIKPPLVYQHEGRIYDPKFITGGTSIRGTFNRFNHSLREKNLRWNSFEWSIHTVRLFTSLFTFVSLIILFVATRQIFNKHDKLPYLITIFAGLMPKVAHRSVSIVSIPLLILSFTFFFYLVLTKTPNYKTSLLLGLAAGLALITKITGINLVIFYGIYLLIFISRFKVRVKNSLYFLFGTLLTSGWYLWRNFTLYQDPLALNQAMRLGKGLDSASVSSTIGVFNYWFSVIEGTFVTFWDGFGWEIIFLGRLFQYSILVFCLVSLWGFTYYYQQLKNQKTRQFLFFLALTLIIFTSVFLKANYDFYTPQGKDFFPMLLPISIILISGINYWHQNIKSISKNKFYLPSIIALSVFFFSKTQIISLGKNILNQSGINVSDGLLIAGDVIVVVLAMLVLRQFIFILRHKIVKNQIAVVPKPNGILVVALILFTSNILILFLLVSPKTFGERNITTKEYYQRREVNKLNLTSSLWHVINQIGSGVSE